MSLNKKAFILISLIIGVAILGIIAASRVILVSGYENLEKQIAERNGQRAVTGLNEIVRSIDTLNSDWAHWDDAYEFVQNVKDDRSLDSKKFIEVNLGDGTFSNAKLNAIVFTDIEGNVVYEKGYDLLSSNEIPLPEVLRSHIRREDLLITHTGSDTMSGIISTAEGPMIVSSIPILRSDGSGPVKGTLIIAKYIDQDVIERLKDISQFEFSLVKLEESPFKSKADIDLREVLVEPLGRDLMNVYSIIPDIYGNPAAVGKIEMPREVSNQAQAIIYYFIISIVLIGSIMIGGGIFYQDRVILAPIHKLINGLNAIRLDEDLSHRLTVEGKDEISQLAQNINTMLSAIEEFQAKTLENEKKLAERVNVIQKQNIDLEKTKAAMMNVLEDEKELEESLRESQKNLQNAQRIANMGSWDWDIVNSKLTWSDEIYRIFGVKPQEFKATYDAFLSYVHPDDRDKVDSAVQESLKNKTSYSVEHRIIQPDGEERIVDEKGEAEYDEKGSAIRMTGIVLDITERRELEDVIKKEHDRLDLIISSMGEGLLVIDKDHRLTAINPVAQKLLEVKADEVIGKKWSELAITMKDHSETPIEERSFAKALSEGKTIITSLEDDHSYKTRTGKVFPIVSITAPLKVDGGEIVGAVKVFRDATRERESRHIIEKEVADRTRLLWEERARMVSSINSIQIGFIIADKKDQIIVKNPAVAEILKISDMDVSIERLSVELLANFNLKDELKKCIGEAHDYEKDNIYYKDKFLRIYITPVKVEESQEVIGNVLLIEDVSEEKQLARAKDEFFAVASHELRTPLTAIRGNTSMIMDYFAEKIEDQDLKEMIADMHESSVRLINIVNDFLDASRLEQGKVEMKNEEFDIVEVVRGVVNELDDFAKNGGGINVNIDYSGGPINVFADKARIQQIGHNLVGNAIKFTKQGGVTVRFDIADDRVKVLVTDTGLGISPANQRLLFKKFQQAGEKVLARDVTKGTGMGLYISKLLAEAMGGKIYLEKSQLGQGSTFIFELPLAIQK